MNVLMQNCFILKQSGVNLVRMWEAVQNPTTFSNCVTKWGLLVW